DPTTDETDNILGANAGTNVVAVSGSNGAGYTAAFNIMLNTSGTGTTPTTTSSLTASLASVKVKHGTHHTRRLHAKVTTNETVTVKAKLKRHGKTLAGAHGQLTPGEHSVGFS